MARWRSGLLDRGARARGSSGAQRVLLERLFQQARDVPAYANAAHMPRNGDALAHLSQAFPIIDKAEVLRRQAQFLRKGHMPSHRLTVAETSGTTGTPLDVYRSVGSMLAEEAFHLQHWHWAGWRPGQKQAVLRGDRAAPNEQSRPPYWFTDTAGKQLILSTLHLDRHNAVMFATNCNATAPRTARLSFGGHDLAAFIEESGLS